jgi:hypothetical protein
VNEIAEKLVEWRKKAVEKLKLEAKRENAVRCSLPTQGNQGRFYSQW